MKVSKIVVNKLNKILTAYNSDYRLQLTKTVGLSYSTEGKEIDAESVTLKVTSDGGIEKAHIITKIHLNEITEDNDICLAETIIHWAITCQDTKTEFINIPSFKTLLENKFGD